MDWLHEMIENTQAPVVTAFLLGLVVALHPCPLATNIAAMGYIAKDMGRGKRILISGLCYTLGRVLAYSLLGIVLIVVFRGSVDMESLGRRFGEWGEKLLSPLLIIIGLYFLLTKFFHKHEHCPTLPVLGLRLRGNAGSLVLGILLALSFCPESAIVYFGMLMPLSAKAETGVFLPVVFSMATAIPTVLIAWVVAFGASGMPVVRASMHAVQRWMSIVVGILFIGAGIMTALY